MTLDVREQACWLALVFESGLKTRVVNDILVTWCYQKRQRLQAFLAEPQRWIELCKLEPDVLPRLERARAKLDRQALLLEQLTQASISLITIFDEEYPRPLKSALRRAQTPPLLFYRGDLQVLQRPTIAIIGSRNAGELSLAFTREAAHYLASQGANVISGNARGVDQAAYDGALDGGGYTTLVLPHGMRKLKKEQMSELVPKIECGQVLLLSQFYPDAHWLVSRAMMRNKVVTGLAQQVIVAESDTRGGTWAAAQGALAQQRQLSICQLEAPTLPGNSALLQLGAFPLPWPSADLADSLAPLLQAGHDRQAGEGNPSIPS